MPLPTTVTPLNLESESFHINVLLQPTDSKQYNVI